MSKLEAKRLWLLEICQNIAKNYLDANRQNTITTDISVRNYSNDNKSVKSEHLNQDGSQIQNHAPAQCSEAELRHHQIQLEDDLDRRSYRWWI